jgi:uncharacterized LabA/DUF88 family protein
VVDIYYFGGIISKKAYFDKNPNHTLSDFLEYKKGREQFFKFLKRVGYKVRTKPVASIYDSTRGEYKRKCNFDVEMTIIAIDRLKDYEEFVLCSGDGDFVKLIKYLKGKYKKTTLISHKDRYNWQLEKAANRVIFIEDIRKAVERDK